MMKFIKHSHPMVLAKWLALAACLALTGSAGAATNWIAFNDHVPGPGTAPNATAYNMRGLTDNPPEPIFGQLTNFLDGMAVDAYFVSSANGAPDFFGSISYPNMGTPAYELFNGKIDIGNQNSAIGIRATSGGVPNTSVTLTFTNLDPSKLYVFRASTIRGNNYTRRWTLASIRGALSYQDIHTTGVYTKDNFPSGTMTNGQAAYNSGENRADGAVVGWSDIKPAEDGSFFVKCEQYVDDPLPNGLTPDLSVYGYAFAGFMLAETGEPSPLGITMQPPANLSIEQFRPLSITLLTTGSSPNFQWYKGVDPIPGATRRTYTVPQASLDDSGDYFCIGTNSLNSVTSTVSHVVVYADTNGPRVLRAVGTSPTSFSVYYDEALDSDSVADPFNASIDQGVGISGSLIHSNNAARVDYAVTPPMTLGETYTFTAYSDFGATLDLGMNEIDRDHATASFVAQYYDGDLATLRDLPTTGKLPLGSLTERGFDMRLVQIATNKVATGTWNNLSFLEAVLANTVIDTATGQPHVNITPLPCAIEPGVINYNKDAPAAVGTGHLGATRQFPGVVPEPGAVVQGLGIEALCYVELQPGIHRWGVNSDDGFRVTLATSAFDSAFTFGEFNGGRGAADTVFDFNVTEAGLYPVRLIFEEGDGGASVEFWSVDLLTSLTTFIGINDPAGVKAFRPPSASLRITPSGANDVVCWPAGNAPYCLQSTTSLTPPITWTDVTTPVMRDATGNCVTVPNGGATVFYRLILKPIP